MKEQTQSKVNESEIKNGEATIFKTETGISISGVGPDEMIELDRVSTEITGPNLFQMMENAGRNLAIVALRELGSDWEKKEVLILAGSGSNGGGGICAARHLANRGISVRLCTSNPERLGKVSSYQRKIFQHTRGMELDPADLASLKADLIIDALVGYRLKGAPRGIIRDLVNRVNDSGVPVVSLDSPTGVDAGTGETPGNYIQAQTTLTLALPKNGLSEKTSGRLFLGDIGIPPRAYAAAGLDFPMPFGVEYIIGLKYS